MTTPTDTVTSPGGVPIDPKGPTVTEINAALVHRGFAKSRTRSGGLPSFGFTASKTQGAAYVVVTTTSGLDRTAEALRGAGYVVETPNRDSELHVFKRARLL